VVLLAVQTLAFILLFVITLSGCSSLLYYPVQETIFNYQELKLPYEELHFPSKNGKMLHAVHFKNRKGVPPKALIVFFHGNGQNLSSHFATLAWILEFSYDYLIFDYEGYGQSEGSPSPENTVKDGIAAIQLATATLPHTPLVIFAQSLGGTVALRSILEIAKDIPGQYPIQWIIIDSSFTSYQAAARSILSRHWLTWIFQPFGTLFLSDEWTADRKLNLLPKVPVLVIHGKKDATIEYNLGQFLYASIPGPKEMWTLEEGTHTDAFWKYDGRYRKKFLEKLDTLFSKKD
jgi:fermentation-respiration switch protein FrsA (DUF1100 family)